MNRPCLTCGNPFTAETATTICGRCEYIADSENPVRVKAALEREERRRHVCQFDFGDGRKAVDETCRTCGTRVTVQGNRGRGGFCR